MGQVGAAVGVGGGVGAGFDLGRGTVSASSDISHDTHT